MKFLLASALLLLPVCVSADWLITPEQVGERIYECGPFVTTDSLAHIVNFVIPGAKEATVSVFVPKFPVSGMWNSGSNMVIGASPYITDVLYHADYYRNVHSNEVRYADSWYYSYGWASNSTRYTNLPVITGGKYSGQSLAGTYYPAPGLGQVWTNSSPSLCYSQLYYSPLSGGYWWLQASVDIGNPAGYRAGLPGNAPGYSGFPMTGTYPSRFGTNALSYDGVYIPYVQRQSVPHFNTYFYGGSTATFYVVNLQEGIRVKGIPRSNCIFKVHIVLPPKL